MTKNRVEARLQKENENEGTWHPCFGVKPKSLKNSDMVEIRFMDNSETMRPTNLVNWSDGVENFVVAWRPLEEETEVANNEVNFHGKFEDMEDDLQEQIINPKHYKIVPPGTYENGLEYMDICDFALSHLDGVKAHLVGQILKYTLRVGKKDAFLQDSRKIEWYAKRLVETVQKEQ